MTFIVLLVSLVLFFILFSKINKIQEQISALEAKMRDTTPVAGSATAAETATPAPSTEVPSVPAPTPPSSQGVSYTPQLVVERESQVPAPTPLYGEVPGVTTPAGPQAVPAAISPKPKSDPLRWFKEHTLIKVGALIFFLGAVWFVSYAISQGWISPATRIYLGILLGIVVLVIAHVIKAKGLQQYLVLTVLGSGIVIASVYTGQFLFSVFVPLVAMAILLVTIGYAVFVSVNTNTQWLGLLSAVAALIAPVLINNPTYEPIVFFFYLFVISLGFSMVVLKTTWRAITLTLLLGVMLYLLVDISKGEMTSELVWFFTVLFSALFFVVTTLSLYRTRVPHAVDLTVLGIISIAFLTVAHEFALVPTLAAFISMAVVAGTGYYFHLLALPSRVQAVYAGIATLHLVVGTSFLLDGFTLTLAYTAEITLLLLIALYARLPARAIGVTASLIVIPMVTSLSSMTASAWNDSALHVDAVTLYALMTALFAVAVFAWYETRRGAPKWYLAVSGWYGLLGYGYAILITGLVANAITVSDASRDVLMYVSWTMITLLLLVIIDRLRFPYGWRAVLLVALSLPVMTSFRSMVSDNWRDGVFHPDAYGLLFMVIVSIVAAIFNLRRFLFHGEMARLKSAGLFLVSTYVYTVVLTGVAAGALFADDSTVNVVRVVSWTFVSYAFVTILFHITVPTRWVLTSLLTLALPVLLAAGLLVEGDWESPVAIEAIGLYFVTIILIFLAITLKRQLPYYQGDREMLGQCITPLLVIAGISAVRCVWLITHSVIDENDYAVMVALFVYTATGLYGYLLGSSRHHRVTKLVGIILLSGVVLRLLLVEVWVMEVFWRIITFMVIGALFIAAALLEARNKEKNNVSAAPSPIPDQPIASDELQ